MESECPAQNRRKPPNHPSADFSQQRVGSQRRITAQGGFVCLACFLPTSGNRHRPIDRVQQKTAAQSRACSEIRTPGLTLLPAVPLCELQRKSAELRRPRKLAAGVFTDAPGTRFMVTVTEMPNPDEAMVADPLLPFSLKHQKIEGPAGTASAIARP